MTTGHPPSPALARLGATSRDVAFEFDAPFGARTTYRVGGRARALAVVESAVALLAVAEAAAEDRLPVLVMGRGSNMLVADAGFDGVVVVLGAFAERFTIPEGGDPCAVEVGAAVMLPVLARRLVGAGLRGLEWSVGVPGSVGGAVRMNAGGHGSDIAASVSWAEVVDLESGDVRRWTPDELGLGFRSSALDDSHVVTCAGFGLRRGDVDEGRRELEDVVSWRRAHQPGGQNCGSVFVNPVPGRVAAGALIDGLGLRGFRIGSAEVSSKHANFIQADPGGSADDVLAVMEHVRSRVMAETGHDLRSEVRLVGFGPRSSVPPGR